MQLKKTFLTALTPVMAASFLLAGCGSGDGKTGQSSDTPPETQAPAKVVAYSYWQEFSDDYWNTVLLAPLKKKYPNIQLEIVKPGKNGTAKLVEMITAGEVPDIVISDIGTAPAIADLGFNYDMSPMIKKYGIDLSKYDQETLNYVKTFSKSGGLITLPYSTNFIGLFYNKDIFDKFGVPYPKDGVTFKEIVSLAKRLTRKEQETQYIGFDHNSIHFLAGGITRDYFDPQTGKANLSTKEWRMAYELLSELIAIPGNRFPQDQKQITRWHNEDFYKTQIVAMIGVPNLISAGLQTVPDMNWDMTSYPVFEQYPKTAQAAGGRGMFINPGSKVLDAAFKVVETAISQESQIVISKNGEQPFMLTKETMDAFCADLPYTKGKNVKAAFYNKQNYPKHPTEYDGTALGIAYTRSLDLYAGKDINTVIRETEEAIDKEVEKLKAAKSK
ncbi:ABC transporter substrate-binding protein [Paenibacillus sp. GYB003]|uniref:ABC transporter substrate-binding protein n=1 Tax=Paenibacillus sp. GYB003 TaxID=2994392 RepID=UPI002F968495